MALAANYLENIFYESRAIEARVGCWIEYNMNNFIANISVTSTKANTSYYHIFPLDSITKPFRPSGSGIKNVILSTYDNPSYVSSTALNKSDKVHYPSIRSVLYPSTGPRNYYAGLDSAYKYYLTEKGGDLNATIKYVQSSINIVSAYASGDYIHYQTNGAHGLTQGLVVSVSGFSNTSLNCSSLTISQVPDYNSFRVLKSTSIIKKVTQTVTGTLSTKTNYAVGNKIIATFNKDHYLPPLCSIKIKSASSNSGTDSEVTISNISVPSDGKVAIYFNGTAWTTTAPKDPSTDIPAPSGNPTSAISFDSTRYVSQITIDSSGSANKFIGLIEFALLYTKDITSDIVSLSVTKDSSNSNSEMLPVGLVTANNIKIDLANYDLDTSKYKIYTPGDIIDISYIYLYKNIKLIPFVKVYDGNGPIVGYNESNNFFRLIQGSYYVSDYTIDTYGSVTINGLDGAKYLMEKTAPDLLLESFPATAVIRSLLDSVGFIDYNMNVLQNSSGIVTDTSVPTVVSWWTDGTKTVWQCIQELCQDMQINAIFDNNGVLQFYTRDYLYSSERSTKWNFYYDQEGTKLPNIIAFDQVKIQSANQVKVKWQTPISSKYAGSSTALWNSPVTYLAAGGLMATIEADSSAENTLLLLSFATIDQYATTQTIYSFTGYLLIDSEIIEYDAIQYECHLESPIDGQSIIYVWITSESDINQYRSLSKSGYSDPTNPSQTSYFKPTGRYRVKTRGALGTKAAKHNATGSLADLLANGWTSVGISWKEK